MLSKQSARWLARLGLLLALGATFPTGGRADDNMLADLNSTDNTPLVDNPWGGVINGVLTAQGGIQLAVDEEGKVNPTVFGPSVALADLNGDGLTDIVMADPRGYFWFYPNSGTPTVPKFTGGEVMPIWIGAPLGDTTDQDLLKANFDAVDNIVPRIQAIDYTGEKRPSIVAGNYEGKLFYIHNIGSTNQPAFSMPTNLDTIMVSTYSENRLWCNFLAPFLYDFTGNGHLDLVIGEGTYASNSIYLLTNKGNNGSPTFSELTTRKIIPGYGREHLTPQVVDWNNDGKPDIICGEKQGFIDLYLNTSPDNDPAHMQFNNPPPPDGPPHVSFGDVQQLGALTTVAVGDLTHNKLPNLLLSNSDDQLSYALNIGKLGTPAFGAPVPVKGVNPFPKVFAAPQNWRIFKAFSMPYVLLVSTKAKDDPTFKAPDDAPTIKSALKIYTVPHRHVDFPNEIYPTQDTHLVQCTTSLTLQAGAHYDITFDAKTDGTVANLRYFFAGDENLAAQGINDPSGPYRSVMIMNPIDASSDWTQNKGDVHFDPIDKSKPENVTVNFYFAFEGAGGSVWLTGFHMTKSNGP